MWKRRPGALCSRVLLALIATESLARDFTLIGPAPYCAATVIHGPNGRGASSAAPQGRAMILWDPAVMDTLPYLEAFALAHECAHHELGHTSPAGMLKEGYHFRKKELAADCWAARTLTERGENDVLTEQIALWQAQTAEATDPRYPSWAERIDTLRRCARRD